MDLARRLYPTGNHFVSLPVVGADDASVDRVGVLHMGTASLMEFGGPQAKLGAETLPAVEPFLRPFAQDRDRRVWPRGGLAWRRLAGWVPTFEWRDAATGLTLRGTVFAPVWRDSEGLRSHKGFVYVLEVLPRRDRAGAVRLGLALTWGDLLQTVYTSRRLRTEFTVRKDRWTGGPVLEPRSGAGAGPAAVAVSFAAAPEDVEWSPQGARSGLVRLEMTVRPAPAGGRTAEGGWLATAFYFGLSREGDGARAAAIDLARRGWEALLEETLTCLRGLRRPVRRRGPSAADPEADLLEERLNLNLLFNYFFAAGRTIDTEELVLVTSRSPLYYVSAAFWARDALLWSFPGLLLADPVLAEEAVGLAFDRYFRHAGVHSLYMDGTLLYPGFELDELAAYPVALWRYVQSTGDRAILARRTLGPKIRRVLRLLAEHKHPSPDVDLYQTFLLPSDDPATHPYVTYDNVLAWRALLCAADLLEWDGAPSEEAAAIRGQAERLKAAILRYCVVPAPAGEPGGRLSGEPADGTPASGSARKRMFAWSTDLAGGTEIGDEPPGSLELLAYYGFCPRDDETWQSTVGWLHSRRNPYRYTDVPFPGLGCPHAKHPFVMSLFNALLGGLESRVEEARKVLLTAPLDTGLACESFDRETGEVKTGAALATCAGFLAYAMDAVFGSGGSPGVGGRGEYRNGPRFVE